MNQSNKSKLIPANLQPFNVYQLPPDKHKLHYDTDNNDT